MPPLSLLIKPVSGRCNMRCKYCFYADEVSGRASGDAGVMTERTLENLTARAFRYAEDAVYFAFQGGEPTLAGLDFFRDFVKRAEDKCPRGVMMGFSIQTNGMVIDDEWAEFFAENNFLVGISMDGYHELHDLYRVDAGGNGSLLRLVRLSVTHWALYPPRWLGYTTNSASVLYSAFFHGI